MTTIKDNETFFGGFEAVLDTISATGSRSKVKDSEDDEPGKEDIDSPTEVEDEEELDDIDKIVDPEVVKGKKKETKIKEEEEPEDEEEEEEVSELSEYEEDIASYLSERLENELGLSFDEELKPKSVKDIVSVLSALVEENSKPTFASEEMEKLNQFILDGGDIRKYIETAHGEVDLDKIDITDERIQRQVVTENLERLGYSKDRIQRMIDRYEDAGTLDEEADDALEELKEHREKEARSLLANQENLRKEARERQQNFIRDVQKDVERMDSIRGIPVTAKEKQQLMDYMFRPEADGKTKYQKEYAKDYKNLIESAYFTMKGDALLNKITKKVTSQAARNLQDKLASKGKRVKSSGGNETQELSSWDAVVSQMRGPKY